jgi:hypothetical protein
MGKPKKRAVKDVPIFVDRIFDNLQELNKALENWHYKTQPEMFAVRDRALFCALILIGARASEMRLKRKQFLIKPNEVVLVNVETVKRGEIRREITLPRTGSLSIYTDILVNWLEQIEDPEAYVFPCGDAYGNFLWKTSLGRKRIWQIIKCSTGLFPHWFRGVHETIYGRLVFQKDAWKLKDHMGLKRLESTAPYVRGEMEKEDKQRLKTL